MESYIEISAIHSVATIILSLIIGEYTALQPLSLKRIIQYALLISCVGCFSWFPYASGVVVCVEIVAFFTLFRYAYKTYFCALIIRYLSFASAFLLYGGGFHNGAWFVPLYSGVYALWFVYALVYVLLRLKWNDVFSRLSYVYETIFFTDTKTFTLKAYLDSGNLVSFQGIPVLFVDQQFRTYFENQRIELIVINSVTSTDVLRCYECDIRLAGCKRQRVYVHVDRHLKLPFTCRVLLNMKVMTMG